MTQRKTTVTEEVRKLKTRVGRVENSLKKINKKLRKRRRRKQPIGFAYTDVRGERHEQDSDEDDES